MIVVVEGPSAAGKTTWAARHGAGLVVPEPAAEGGADWAATNADRWRAALDLERRHGVAVCDTDPFKLHYSWCRCYLGEVAVAEWEREAAGCRDQFAARELGLADVVLCAIPDGAELAARKQADRTRRRRRFPLHARLAEPLRLWYQVVDALDPGRVLWEHPEDGLAGLAGIPARPERSGMAIFDALVASLPAPPRRGPAGSRI